MIRMRSSHTEARLQETQSENERLREQLRSLQRNRFGKKSERFETPEQGILFNEVEVLAGMASVNEEDSEATIEPASVEQLFCLVSHSFHF